MNKNFFSGCRQQNTTKVFENFRSVMGFSKSRFAMILVLCWLSFAGFKPAQHSKATITIQFKNRVGDKALKLFDETYTDPFGEPFVISKFRYYISHLSLTDINNKEIIQPDNYYLINEEDSVSKMILLPFEGSIKSISFLLGVDSIKNVSGVQTGSLDPLNGMFWTWNSGYVFAKLEGQSDSSHAPTHIFNWDVGGFRQPDNALRKIKLVISRSAAATDNTIVINADVLKWFNAVHDLKISASPVCHQPGKLAMQIADNYSTMFSIAP